MKELPKYIYVSTCSDSTGEKLVFSEEMIHGLENCPYIKVSEVFKYLNSIIAELKDEQH